MGVNVYEFGDNASLPFSGSETYIPDQLIAGAEHLVTANIILTGGELLQRGTVLGMVTEGSSEGLVGTTVAASGNVGNGTIGSIAFYQGARPGIYKVAFTGTTTFDVTDPDNIPLVSSGTHLYGPNAQTSEIGFTFTAGGTGMSAGDEILIIAAPSGVGSYKISKANATDGSQKPCAILCDITDASEGDVAGGAYIKGEFNVNSIVYDPSWTPTQLTALLRGSQIYIKTPVPATDPTTQTGGAMGT